MYVGLVKDMVFQMFPVKIEIYEWDFVVELIYYRSLNRVKIYMRIYGM